MGPAGPAGISSAQYEGRGFTTFPPNTWVLMLDEVVDAGSYVAIASIDNFGNVATPANGVRACEIRDEFGNFLGGVSTYHDTDDDRDFDSFTLHAGRYVASGAGDIRLYCRCEGTLSCSLVGALMVTLKVGGFEE
jgi:hypothetical protein